MNKGITIFTPTYNRAYTLERLYNSLKNQTCKDFEWIIVDDGSTDETKETISDWKKENIIPIRYFYQENAGKMQAHNKGTQLAGYELFCCVDSDDYLVKNAVEEVLNCWDKLKNDPSVIGIIDFRVTGEGENITKTGAPDVIGKKCTLMDAYRKYKLRGDTMLIYRTERIRQFVFPKFEGEKFIPEAFLYDQLDLTGNMFIQGEKLYICEYLPDGYTANIRKINANNPKGYEAFVSQRLKRDKGLEKYLDLIRYQAIEFRLKELKKDSAFNVTAEGISALIPGWIFYRKKYWKYSRK